MRWIMSRDKTEVSTMLAAVYAELPPELAAVLVARKLANNRDSYGTRDWLLFDKQQKMMQLIKERLLKVPLVHVTSSSFDAAQKLQPHVNRPDGQRGNTTGFDRSLGLDQYVFLRWGLPDLKGDGTLRYGNVMLLIDPSILNHRNTIVTPKDIGEIGSIDDTPYQDLSARDRIVFDKENFDKLVSGNDWLDIIAYKGLVSYQLETPCYPPPLKAQDFGEVKYFGAVDSSFIIDKMAAVNLPDHYKNLSQLGLFVDGYGDIAQARQYWDSLFASV
jgi:hypothetical protein